MNRKRIWLSAAFLVFFMAGAVNASYIGTSTEGDPAGMQDSEESVLKYLTDVQDLYEITLDDLNGLEGFKIDSPKNAENYGGYTVYIDKDGNSGTWSAPEGVDFVTVKAGTQYDIFLADDFNWNTSNNKDISHITFWTAPKYDHPGGGGGGGSSAVPEPTTMALLFGGLGVLGYNTFRKKFARKKD